MYLVAAKVFETTLRLLVKLTASHSALGIPGSTVLDRHQALANCTRRRLPGLVVLLGQRRRLPGNRWNPRGRHPPVDQQMEQRPQGPVRVTLWVA
jgi:hypothetical protein